MERFAMRPVGYVRTPFTETRQIPKGRGARHEEEGAIEVLPEFEEGLTHIEGFSHLFVIWAFDRAEGYDLMGRPPSDDRPHGVFATRSPRRPNPIGLTVVELLGRQGPRPRASSHCGRRSPISTSSSPTPRWKRWLSSTTSSNATGRATTSSSGTTRTIPT